MTTKQIAGRALIATGAALLPMAATELILYLILRFLS
jgi:hypothetical protein